MSKNSANGSFLFGRPSTPCMSSSNFAQTAMSPIASPGDIQVKLPGSTQTPTSFQRAIEQPHLHLPASSQSHRAEATLKRMYQTGEYSDVTVVAGDTTYAVHKSIICSSSAWFEEACKTQDSPIMTSIAPTVVDSIFCYLYATEVPILTSTKPSLGLTPSQSAQAFGTVSALSNEFAREDLYNVVELISASKLWGLGDLTAQAADVLSTKLQLYEPCPEAIAFTAAMIYKIKANLTPEANTAIGKTVGEAASAAVKTVVKILPSIMGNEAADKHLVDHPGLMHDVLTFTASGRHTADSSQRVKDEPPVPNANIQQPTGGTPQVQRGSGANSPWTRASVGPTKRLGEILESERQKRSRDGAA